MSKRIVRLEACGPYYTLRFPEPGESGVEVSDELVTDYRDAVEKFNAIQARLHALVGGE